MTNYRPIDSKREEFRKYLERAGVMDALTKALVSLYEEADKPTDALDFLRKSLGDNRPDEGEIQAIRNELEDALALVRTLKEDNAALKEKLQAYEPSTEEPPEGENPATTGEAEGAPEEGTE